MITKIPTFSFYILFFVTPLFWSPFNFELFEYNKMMLVYFLTVIIATCWILNMIQKKSLILKSTPLDIPISIFLGANIISTIFSIDPHVSWWGYYSRSNGGLISIIAYTILYFALVSNFSAENAVKFLKAAVLGGVVVALYAIPEHFGISPSCVILTNKLSAACWVQDVQSRVFATLGQPNWLAAYLAMLIFPTFYFLLTSTKKSQLITYLLSLITLYLAFTFTYSRGATLGLIGGLIVFLGFLILSTKNIKFNLSNLGGLISKIKINPKNIYLNQNKPILIILSAFIIINLIFGSALTSFKLVSKFTPQARPGLITQTPPPSGTQLENGGTESGAIRLIVWRGAIDIFLHNPILGTGIETFAYSYYQYRPQEHNLVSEWDFLYNKAHNEYLNYLANTGIVGFLAYMAVIVTFIVFCIKYYILSIKGKKQSESIIHNTYPLILIPAILASYVSYLIQNFFSFSVVIIAVFFYLFPAIAFIATDCAKPVEMPKKFLKLKSIFLNLIYKKPFYTKLTKTIVIVISGLFVITLIKFYWADTYFASGNNANEAGNPGRAYNQLMEAVSLNGGEPYYLSELSYAAAASAVAIEEDDATISARLKDEAIAETEKVLRNNPKNVSFYRTAIRTYYVISTLDPTYTEKTLEILDQTIAMAPTDSKLTYNKAIILGQIGRNEEAIQNLQKTIALKPNYRDAYYTLGLFFFEEKQKNKAVEQIKKILQLVPGDPEATAKLKEWGG